MVSPVSAGDTPWLSPNEGRTTEDSVIGTSHPLRIIDTADLVEYLSDEYAFIQKWGSYGTGDGQFSGPCGITIASDGLVFVTDWGNSRVQVFDSNGNYIRKWGSYGTGNGQFNGPWGSAIHPVSGNIYVTDQNNHRVQVFDSTGTFIRKWGVEGTGNGQFYGPRGIAIDTDGNVYVVDSWNNRIQKFTADGTFIRKWGAVGTGDGQFNNPLGIAVHPHTGYIYVAEGHPDSDYSRIQVFDSNGNYIRKWGSFGTGNGQFHQPFGVAIDEVGTVFITDVYNYRVQVFDSNGNFITKWGGYGSGDGQFDMPFGIVADAPGNVYVADGDNNCIQKFGSITPTTVLSGRVTDGVTGEPISGVTISIAGLSDTTDDNGDYRINNIPPAYLDADFYADIRSGEAPLQVQFTDISSDNAHTLTATKTGYVDYTNRRVIVTPDETTLFSFSMNPVLSPDSMRFILNWGANPRDLDLHLQTPEIEGTSYHVYYFSRGSLDSLPYAALDQDVVSGYGPETITISRLFEGTYYLYVYLYAGTGTLATSEASIQLYNDEGLIQTLHVPATGTGRYWNIATINGATGHLSIVNQIQGDIPGVLSLDLLSNELTTLTTKPLAHDTLMATELTYEWSFGDGATSNEQHPNHIYTDIGNYTVTLTVTNDEGDEDTETKVGYITVTGAPIPPADLPEHSLYLGHTAVSIGYLIGHPVDAQTLVNTLVGSQGLSMADLWYRIGDGAVVNILTGEEANPAQLAAIQAQLRTYIDENGNAHEIVHQYAVGRIVVGAMNFNDLYINDVVGVLGATHFSVSEVDIIRAIGSDTPLTFMKTGSTTLQIYSDADGDTLIATGTLVIPGTFGEHPFEVSLNIV
jgi:DNA-binding beta-propeller fold protein YncE